VLCLVIGSLGCYSVLAFPNTETTFGYLQKARVVVSIQGIIHLLFDSTEKIPSEEASFLGCQKRY